jgi:hypothetical protein
MNAQTPPIVKQGVTAIIGKGHMSLDVPARLLAVASTSHSREATGHWRKKKSLRSLGVHYADLVVTEAV